MDLRDLAKVCEFDCGLLMEKPLVVGVSGGPDSLGLLHILAHLGYFCIAVHVNHQLRPEAEAEAEVVRDYCEKWQIPFFLRRVDVHTLAKQEKLSIEESARILRYRALMQTATEVSAQAVAVAHHADDQVETILMHLLRGAGAGGLKGMSYRFINSAFSETTPIVRPLLGVDRAEILAYCRDQQIEPCQDLSNNDPTYFRNRIRGELVPLLKTYNTQASRHLWQLAYLVGDENRYLDELTQAESLKVICQSGQGYLVLDRQRFQQLDQVLQRRLIRQCLAKLRMNLRDIGYEPVENAVSYLLDSFAHGSRQILDGLQFASMPGNQALMFTGQADLSTLWPVIKTDLELEASFPGELWLNDHWKIEIEILAVEKVVMQPEPEWAYFDADALSQLLTIGICKKGERFTPFGLETGSMKVGDYFTNLHYPEPARHRWPILRTDDHLLWIVGLRRSRIAEVKESTQRILRMHLVYTK
jgi:tRNA(Ile)-lysidine synthase